MACTEKDQLREKTTDHHLQVTIQVTVTMFAVHTTCTYINQL